jgi:5-formyltetrahydrofolate cyclo-ligase
MLKAELRTLFLQKRKEITEIQFQELNKNLCSVVLGFLKNLPTNQKCASFLPIIAKNEVNTILFHEEISQLNLGHLLYFPRVMNQNDMQFYCIKSKDELALSNWGIPEPLEIVNNLIDPKEIQIMFIPLLAFDVKGHRVGYGRGFYDQYLAKCSDKLIKIGLSLFDEPSEIDDVEITDITLDFIITPSGLVRVEKIHKSY